MVPRPLSLGLHLSLLAKLLTISYLGRTYHIKNVCNLFNKKLAVLKGIEFLPQPTLKSIYFNSIILVLYIILLFGALFPYHL